MVQFHGTQNSDYAVVLSPLPSAYSVGLPPPHLLPLQIQVTKGQSRGGIGSPTGSLTTTTPSGVCLFTLEGRRCWLFYLTAPFRALLLLLMLAGKAVDESMKLSPFLGICGQLLWHCWSSLSSNIIAQFQLTVLLTQSGEIGLLGVWGMCLLFWR